MTQYILKRFAVFKVKKHGFHWLESLFIIFYSMKREERKVIVRIKEKKNEIDDHEKQKNEAKNDKIMHCSIEDSLARISRKESSDCPDKWVSHIV